jgi:hypothetical protein
MLADGTGLKRVASAGAKGSTLSQHLTTLLLVQAAPDAVGLADLKSELEAGLPDGTPSADRLGPELAGGFLLTTLEVAGGEEQRGIVASAGGLELPPLGASCRHPLGHGSLLDGHP